MTPSSIAPLWQSWALAQVGQPPAGPVFPGESTTAQPNPAGQPGATGAPGTSPPPAGGGGMQMLLMVGLFMIVLFMITGMSGRKERKRRATMLAELGRNDRVQTVGGVIGTVVELHDAEIVLRVDEASNTRVRFARSAIQQVLRSSRDKSAGSVTEVEVKPGEPSRV